jgi:hypothetical protein
MTPEDLYGPSNPPTPEGAPAPTIPVEETPEIPMPQPQADQPLAGAPQKQKGSFWSVLGAIILFVGLFGLGIWLSSYVRQYLPNALTQLTVIPPTPTPQPKADQPLAGTPVDPYAGWKMYQVVSGTTKFPIPGISYKLPPEILAPICDTTTCMSQGTYLPGGTRFTVAPRGAGQLLADFRGTAISDVGGVVFATKDTTVNGHAAKLFTGNVTGKTVAGYGFSQMRGYMIEVTSTLSLEMNHFAPVGVIADFAKDDILFDQIIGTLVMPGPVATPTAIPLPTSTASAIPATTSGY